MYQGTMIDELMASVERAEARSLRAQSAETVEIESWSAVANWETSKIETEYLGVA
jgi:hypothetical protein